MERKQHHRSEKSYKDSLGDKSETEREYQNSATTSTTNAAPPPEWNHIKNEYKFIKFKGGGTFGQVYKAEHIQTG